jgi:CRISPR-associated protein Csx1
LVISRNWEFREDFANLVRAYLVSSILEKFGFNKLNDVPLSKIEALKEKFYKKFPIESNRIDVEIGSEKEKRGIKGVKGKLTNEYKPYFEIAEKEDRDLDKRVFFAHAGLAYNVIELKKENDEIYIRIYNKNEKETKNLILDNLPQIQKEKKV